jgi:hypothetical protein
MNLMHVTQKSMWSVVPRQKLRDTGPVRPNSGGKADENQRIATDVEETALCGNLSLPRSSIERYYYWDLAVLTPPPMEILSQWVTM